LKISEHNKLVSCVLDELNPILDEELEQFKQEYQQANSAELAAISGNLALGKSNDQFMP
jgi:fructose-1-phosphate kinase PfkB-like protein